MYEEYFEQLKEECPIRNRSPRTAETYISNIKSFIRWTGHKPMQEFSLQDARDFILFKRKSGVSASACNFYNSSICFLYKHILHIPWDQDLVPRMRIDETDNGLEEDDPNYEEYHACAMKIVKIIVNKNKNLKEGNLIEINYHNYPQQIKDSQDNVL